jgi:hypothetical protein
MKGIINRMSEIQVNDYIEGYGYRSHEITKIRGWVNQIYDDYGKIIYLIKPDDNWQGLVGNAIFSELGKVVKLENKNRSK